MWRAGEGAQVPCIETLTAPSLLFYKYEFLIGLLIKGCVHVSLFSFTFLKHGQTCQHENSYKEVVSFKTIVGFQYDCVGTIISTI